MPQQVFQVSVKELLTGDVALASPPELFLKLRETLENPAKSMKDASRLIEHDPGLSARLLRIVNSAFYGFPSKIDAVEKAIGILGAQELQNLVMATLAVDRFSEFKNGLMTMREFWTGSVRRALLAKFLAAKHPNSKRLSSVFLCGLLLDVGRLIIYHRLPELARAAILKAKTRTIDETDAQMEVLGFDHFQVSAELARSWRLPEPVAATMDFHRVPEQARYFYDEIHLVALASRLTMAVSVDSSASAEDPDSLSPLLTASQLSPTQMEKATLECDNAFNAIFSQIYGH